MNPQADAAYTAVTKIAVRVQEHGGRALLVGGCVRDTFLSMAQKDFDLEIYGLPVEELKGVLAEVGTVGLIGESFGVFILKEYPGLDISIPRRDNKIGAGHRDFAVAYDPTMTIEEAARRRDFTMNSMAQDPLTGEFFDPFNGQEDLRNRILRVTDPQTFVEDQLRALRAVQFCSRFNLTPTPATIRLIRNMDLQYLSGERVLAEFEKFLLSRSPGYGFRMLQTLGLHRFFPELYALDGCQQELEWHPEGDVYTHTALALDAAVELRTGNAETDRTLMWSVLCHDLGKPASTEYIDGRWRSRGHESTSAEPVRNFLDRFDGIPKRLVEQIVVVAENHLAPAVYPRIGSGPAAYRRLARKLTAVGLTIYDLHRISSADQFGRTTLLAQRKIFLDGAEFITRAIAAGADKPEYKDVVLGRHLIALGHAPGPSMGVMLKACREAQIELGLTNGNDILVTVGIISRDEASFPQVADTQPDGA
jgi:tRNA nucleotidyltransferase (CCA-adding enzyme)